MATQADFAALGSVPAPAAHADRDARFFARLSLGLSLFIAFAFAQFSARGMVDIARVPWFTHAHAAAMVLWLALLSAQPWLVARGGIALHRRVGWASLALLAAIVALGLMAGQGALRNGTVPPFFSQPYFLALTHVGVFAFAAMVCWAVAMRRRTDWHRRLMIGSAVMIMEPALGRLLPMPLLGGWGEWVALVFQLGALALLARHDRRSLGRVHPATVASALAVTLVHAVVETLAVLPPIARLAAVIAAG